MNPGSSVSIQCQRIDMTGNHDQLCQYIFPLHRASLGFDADRPAVLRIEPGQLGEPLRDQFGRFVERFQLRAMQTEPKVVLRTAQTTAQMLVADAPDAKTFRFPASAGPSPAADCCATAEKACPPNPKDFEHASWEALGVHPEGKVRYHYTLTTSGVGPAATLVLRAEGDPQCKGVKDIWEVKGRMEKGALVSDPPVNLTPPKDPAAAPAPTPAPAAKPAAK